ncbi:MAG: L,D-transpeptidase [Chloroflexi bacterium]|nr:L,D-transpeptidase [Chloroflexota bacterium]
MLSWRRCLGLVPVLLVVLSGVATPVAAQTAPPSAAANPLPPDPLWAVNFEPAPEQSAPDDGSDQMAMLRPFTYLAVLGYDGDWARALNPRTRDIGYVPSDSLGPTDPPPAYVTADPPPALDEINADGRTLRAAPVSFFPTPDPDARTGTDSLNTPVTVVDSVQGDDGETWYRTSDGDYLPETSVRLARTPPRTFGGRWIDVDLSEPAMLVAYDGTTPVLTTLTIHGAGPRPTPLGVFPIIRRVANETMNSDTIGIPRFGPGGYYLTNVLFTQYFTPDGASLHYNYWSSNWGYAASHGCLGLTYADSSFLWGWAGLGTPVSIHY